ncbi:unnamed protein product [Paramecium octaurelia]|uniref:Uncharacterized protein n=1 Tax=Paramecium octaurelia TaxID=43137 RepID=A0A8S1YGP0_PAROT|nr:unnamed protein product [Paramecium octaurelia]
MIQSQNEDYHIFQNGQIEQEGYSYQGRLIKKVQFFIECEKRMLKYIKDGEILRMEQLKEKPKYFEILKNLEQIISLRWEGIYGENNKKIGKWVAFWNDQ